MEKDEQAEPLYLMLLGTAGTGKTCCTQTCLQEIQNTLKQVGLPLDFVKAAAPTGSAAFNIRFQASTIHRLIHWFNLRKFADLEDNNKKLSLAKFQTFLQNTQLIVLDEVSMIGRQMMGRINARFEQGKAGTYDDDLPLGGMSCVCVGDPAQCEAISDQQIYDKELHSETSTNANAKKVVLSNIGLTIYERFEKVVILTTCHR